MPDVGRVGSTTFKLRYRFSILVSSLKKFHFSNLLKKHYKNIQVGAPYFGKALQPFYLSIRSSLINIVIMQHYFNFIKLFFKIQVGSSYFGKTLQPTNLIVNTDFHRSAVKGMGGTKFIGNYSPVLKYLSTMKKSGYDDILFLDAKEEKYIEEVASSNLFIVKDKVVYTPELGGN